jgi:RNA polymerase sigma factor (sigma-70 family)
MHPSGSRADDVEQIIYAAVDKGDLKRAGALIVHHYGALLRGHARRVVGTSDEEDVFHDAVLELLDALQKKRFRRESSLRSYAITTVRYVGFTWRRSWLSRLLRRAEPLEGDDDPPAPSSDQPRPWGDQAEEELVEKLLERLDAKQRVVVGMRLEGATFVAIGRALHISEDCAWKIHERALRDLRDHFVVDERGVLVLRKKAPAPPRGGPRR